MLRSVVVLSRAQRRLLRRRLLVRFGRRHGQHCRGIDGRGAAHCNGAQQTIRGGCGCRSCCSSRSRRCAILLLQRFRRCGFPPLEGVRRALLLLCSAFDGRPGVARRPLVRTVPRAHSARQRDQRRVQRRAVAASCLRPCLCCSWTAATEFWPNRHDRHAQPRIDIRTDTGAGLDDTACSQLSILSALFALFVVVAVAHSRSFFVFLCSCILFCSW